MAYIGGYAAETIALCALGFTVWQAYVQRQHNKISLRPHLFTFTNKDKIKNSARLQVLLTNNGLGPAFINKFEVFYDGKSCEPEEAISKAIGKLECNTSHTTLGDDYVMPQNEVKLLLSVTFEAVSWEQIDSVEKQLDRIDLLVRYSSAHDEKYVLDSRENK